MYRFSGIVGIALIIVSCACTHAMPAERELLIVKGAENIEEYQFDGGDRLQVTYWLILEYPDLAIGESQWKELKKRGWLRCTVEKRGWDTFPDLASGDGRMVHRHVSHWAKDDRLITISLSYYSVLREPSRLIEPDNRVQHVLILFESYSDISIIEGRLGISCP